MNIRYILLLLVVPLLALGLACAGDDDDDTNGAATSAAGDETDSPDETSSDDGEPTDESGDTDQPGNGGVAIDPCGLLTNEEAAAAIGGATEEPDLSPEIGEGFAQCLWRIQGGTELDSAVIVQVRPESSSDDYAEQLEENCPDELGEPNPVAGLGDEANECIALIVLSGDVIFAVTVFSESVDLDADLRTQEELAQTIIGRLP